MRHGGDLGGDLPGRGGERRVAGQALEVRGGDPPDRPREPRAAPLDEPGTVAAELVVFPDEPYAFTPDDGPEAWPQARAAFVSGRYLTWYGPSLVEAPQVLARQLDVG